MNIDSVYEELIGLDKKSKKCGSPGKVKFSKNRMMNGGWTHSIVEALFQDFKEKFGAETKKLACLTTPPKDYVRLLKKWALRLSFETDCRITYDAVGLQITWGVTTQQIVKNPNMPTYIRNQAIALSKGIITTKDLPGEATFKYSMLGY